MLELFQILRVNMYRGEGMKHLKDDPLSQIVPGIRQMQLNPVTLGFSGSNRHLELEFKAYFFRKYLFQMRAGMVLAMVFYGLFAFLDAVIVPDLKYTFWFIRFGVVLPIALLSVLFSFTRIFRFFHQPALFLLILLGGSGIIAMIILATPPANYSYYAGLILVFIFGYTFLGLRTLWATAAAWILIAAYQAVAVLIAKTPTIILINNDFFFICASFFGMFAAYSMEYSARLDFYRARLLAREKAQVEDARSNLEQQVSDRTRELQQANILLHQEIDEKNALMAEQERLNQQLTQAQKMEAIGTLAGGIAHDFNNILTPMLGYTELAYQSSPLPETLKGHLAKVLQAGNRAKDLVKQILAFSRHTKQEAVPVAVGPLVKEVSKLMRASIPTTIDIKLEMSAEHDVIETDPTHLHQVLINLCTNAAQAMDADGGVLSITLADARLPVDEVDSKLASAVPGDYLLIQVSDTGTGIAPDVLDRIFEPFFTTKDPGSGTGMGLSVVHGIIQTSGGYITVDSTSGNGSSFRLYFPIAANPVTEHPSYTHDETVSYEGSEHILLADDEEQILAMQKLALTGMGYRVTVCSTGDKALRTFQSQPNAFDLVITDLTMPGLTGDNLARKIRELAPDIPIVLCTGFNDRINADTAGDYGINMYLNKPMSIPDLGSCIRQLLDKKSDAHGASVT